MVPRESALLAQLLPGEHGSAAGVRWHTRSSTTTDERIGTFLGVFVPCTCTIFGVVVFLLLGLVVGEAGLQVTLVVIGASFILSLLTVIAMCALIADADLVDARVLTDAGAPGASSRGPGVYEALRSSAGPELSQAIGLSFFLAFTAVAAFNALGFAQAVGHSLGPGAAGWLAGLMPLEQALGSAALLCFTLLCFYGVRLSGRLSLLMLMTLLASLAASLVCIALPSNDHLAGHIAFSGARLAANFAPQLSSPRGGVLSFALLFPGFTGVIAGSNLSPNLATPTHSIAYGALASLVFVGSTYAVIALTLAASVDRSLLKANTHVLEDTLHRASGLPLAQIGVCAATLSSALSYLLGASHVLHAVATESSWPSLAAFAPWAAVETATSGTPACATQLRPATEQRPVRALLLAWGLAQLFVLSGDLKALAPLVTGFFLVVACLINLVSFTAALSRPHFAAGFKLHSKWTSLGGFLLALVFLADAISAPPLSPLALTMAALLLGLLAWQRRALARLFTIGDRTAFPQAWSAARLGMSGEVGDERVERAAVYVHDGLSGRHRKINWSVRQGGESGQLRAQRLLTSIRLLRHVNAGIYMGLALVETPVWCYSPPCDLHGVPGWGLPMLPQWATLPLEAGCVCIFLGEMGLKMRFVSSRSFFASGWHLLQLLLLLIDAAFIAISAALPDYELAFLNPLLRPLLFLSLFERTRSVVGQIASVVPAVAGWALLILLLLLFFALCGVLLFGGTDPLLAEGGSDFDDLGSALLCLFVLLTTSNYPDVMLPAYGGARVSCLFFVAFIVLGLFLLMNLILASVCSRFRAHAEAAALEAAEATRASFAAAFRELDFSADGCVEAREFGRLLRRVQQPVFSLFDGHVHPALDTALPCAVLQRMMDAFDASHGGPADRDTQPEWFGLDQPAFEECLLLLSHRDDSHPGHPTAEGLAVDEASEAVQAGGAGSAAPLDRWGNAIQQWRRRLRWLLSEHGLALERVVGVVIVLNGAILAAEVELELLDRRFVEQALYAASAPVFAAFYTLELLAKAWALGPDFNTLGNVVDAAVTVPSVVGDMVLWASPGAMLTPRFVRIVFGLRALRLLRLLRLTIADAFAAQLLRLLPKFAGLLACLLCLFAFYAQLGVFFFGGRINEDDWPELVGGTAPAGYILMNYNDFASALVTLFALLVVNNWYVHMEVAVAVTGPYARLYFISWYLVAVTLMLNLVVAYVLDIDKDDAISSLAPKASGAVSRTLDRHSHAAAPPADPALAKHRAASAAEKIVAGDDESEAPGPYYSTIVSRLIE